MGILIDSSVLVAGERKGEPVESFLARHAQEEVAIAAITASELLHGVHRAATPAQRLRREAFVEGILSALPIVPFDAVVARIHADVWAQLARRGNQVGVHDLIIGATALSLQYAVATRDLRSFPRIPGLRVLDASHATR